MDKPHPAEALHAENAKLRRDFDELMGILRDSFMTHGACKRPFACTACSARNKLIERVKAWKGPTYTFTHYPELADYGKT